MDTLLPIAPEPIITPPIPQPTSLKWPIIAIFAFILGVASVLAYQKYLPAGFDPAGASPSPMAVLPSPSVDPTTFKFSDKENLSCPSNFTLYQNRVFSVCQPLEMTVASEEYPAHDRSNIQAITTTFEDQSQKIIIMTAFTGGWGGGYTSEKTTLDTYSATKLTAKDTNNQLANIVVITDNNQSGQFPIAIDYQRKAETVNLNEQLLETLIQSFKFSD